MPNYELVTILSPILNQDEVDESIDRCKAVIVQDGGNVIYEERWGMRRLSYGIKRAGQRYLEGNYCLTRFETEGRNTGAIETHLNLAENVIRYLLVRAELPPGPPPRTAGLRRDVEVVSEPVSGEGDAVTAGAASSPNGAEPSAESVAVLDDEPLAIEDRHSDKDDTVLGDGTPEEVVPEIAESVNAVGEPVDSIGESINTGQDAIEDPIGLENESTANVETPVEEPGVSAGTMVEDSTEMDEEEDVRGDYGDAKSSVEEAEEGDVKSLPGNEPEEEPTEASAIGSEKEPEN